jgi:hypothetical protein
MDSFVDAWTTGTRRLPVLLRIDRGAGPSQLRWSSFSGQASSLTSEAGRRPCKGLPPMSKRRTHSPEFKANPSNAPDQKQGVSSA